MVALMSNLYRGIINPDDANGKKIIIQMTASLADEDKFDLKQENVFDFKENLKEAVNTYYYSIVINTILIEYNNQGNMLETANLLTEPYLCSLTTVLEFS